MSKTTMPLTVLGDALGERVSRDVRLSRRRRHAAECLLHRLVSLPPANALVDLPGVAEDQLCVGVPVVGCPGRRSPPVDDVGLQRVAPDRPHQLLDDVAVFRMGRLLQPCQDVLEALAVEVAGLRREQFPPQFEDRLSVLEPWVGLALVQLLPA
jgi:hypothetical protein